MTIQASVLDPHCDIERFAKFHIIQGLENPVNKPVALAKHKRTIARFDPPAIFPCLALTSITRLYKM